MFGTFKEYFSSRDIDETECVNAEELRSAAAGLMFSMVLADGQIRTEELVTLGQILRQQFDLDEKDIKATTKLARISSQKPGELLIFARRIRNSWGNAKRVALLENLRRIALADNQLLKVEEEHAREIANMLHLTETQVAAAGEHVKKLLNYNDFTH